MTTSVRRSLTNSTPSSRPSTSSTRPTPSSSTTKAPLSAASLLALSSTLSTPLHPTKAQHLLAAAKADDLPTLVSLLFTPPNPSSSPPSSSLLDLAPSDEWGLTPLHYAALHGNADMVDELCHRRAPVNARDRYGQTPLLLACTHGHHKAIIALLDHKASPHLASTSGYTPLHRVAMSASPHAALSAELLLRHRAKLEAQTVAPGGFTPLRLAVRAARIDVVRLLCGKGAKVGEGEVEEGRGVGGMEMVVELVSWMVGGGVKGVSEEERRLGEQRREERERRVREGEERAERARREGEARVRAEEERRRELGEEVKEGLDGRWQAEEELNTARRMQAEAEAEAETKREGEGEGAEEEKEGTEEEEAGEAVEEEDDEAERKAYRERMFALWRQQQTQAQATSAPNAKSAWA